MNFEDKGGCSFNSSKSKMHIKMPKKSLSGSQPVTKQGKAGDSMPALALDWKPLFNRVLFLNGAIFGEEAPEISQMWVVPKCVSKCP